MGNRVLNNAGGHLENKEFNQIKKVCLVRSIFGADHTGLKFAVPFRILHQEGGNEGTQSQVCSGKQRAAQTGVKDEQLYWELHA